MKKSLKQKINNPVFFVLLSLGALVLFAVLIMTLTLRTNLLKTQADYEKTKYDRYYINTDYQEGDYYITKNPQLKDMLAGPIITSRDPSLGEISAPVVLVYFSDFECVFCHEQEKTLRELLVIYKDQVKLVWKDYPESNPDSFSYQAAIAARCAQEQNKFWEYHKELYQRGKTDQAEFLKIAKVLNLKVRDFEKCLKSDRPQELVNENILEAEALEILGVPFLYVNDQEIMGQADLEELSAVIAEELKKEPSYIN